MQDTHVLDTLKVNSYVSSMDHDVFIDEDIENEAYYRSVISTLNKASEKDTIRFIISSNGGFGSTAMTLAHAMDRCPAKKVGILCGNVKSAATIIALHCDDWEVGAGCDWLAHTASFGLGGEAHKVKKHHDHEQELIRRLLFREYEGFYTKEEIQDIANGNDSQLFEEDVTERLRNFAVYRSQQHSSAMEEMFTLQNEQSEKYEEVLIKRLLETGEITQAEADIARKVQAATISLDEKEGDSLFETMNNPCEEDECCVDEESGSEGLILSDVKGMKWKVDFTLDEDDNIDDIVITNANQDYWTFNKRDLIDCNITVLKALADDWEIPYVHNIGVEKLSDKIISYFELEIIEFLSQ